MRNLRKSLQKRSGSKGSHAKPQITVVIPCRETDDPNTTLKYLAEQTFQDFKVVVVKDEGKGASYARNKGFEKVDTEFVLFSDNDIAWKKDGIEMLYKTLKDNPNVAYSYGAYEMEGEVYCHREFDAEALKKGNYVSTMSLIRTKDFPGFDESLSRFQDWDLWLTMLKQGKVGVYCGDIVFKTWYSGISKGNPVEAEAVIRQKHGLTLSGAPR